MPKKDSQVGRKDESHALVTFCPGGVGGGEGDGWRILILSQGFTATVLRHSALGLRNVWPLSQSHYEVLFELQIYGEPF